MRRVWTGPTLVRGTTNMKAEACWRSGAYDPSSSKGLRSLSARSRLPHWVTLCSVPAQAATSCALHHPQNVERLLKRNGAAVRVACTRRQPRTPGRCTARCPLAGQVQGLPVRMAIHTGACGTATAPASAFLERRSSAWPSRRPKSLTSRKLWQVTGRRRCGGLPRLCTKRADASWRAAAGLAHAQAAWEPGRAVDASQAAWEPGRAVDASLLGPPTPPGPPAEVGWLLALAVLCAARLGRGRARADRLRPDLALVRARRSKRSAPVPRQTGAARAWGPDRRRAQAEVEAAWAERRQAAQLGRRDEAARAAEAAERLGVARRRADARERERAQQDAALQARRGCTPAPGHGGALLGDQRALGTAATPGRRVLASRGSLLCARAAGEPPRPTVRAAPAGRGRPSGGARARRRGGQAGCVRGGRGRAGRRAGAAHAGGAARAGGGGRARARRPGGAPQAGRPAPRQRCHWQRAWAAAGCTRRVCYEL